MSATPRNLIICCDGTNNLWSAANDVTNIVKIFRRLHQDDTQLCYYDPGVGTASGQLHESSRLRQRIARLAGLAWGNGVWKNVADAYLWLIHNYQEGDRIFLMGFSRGAFTVRALAGLLYWCHLPKENCEHLIPTFIAAYRVSDPEERRRICRELRQYHSRSRNPMEECFPIEFIGVFDTVESVGLEQIFLGTEVISDNKVKRGVHFVRHAMAIDESRWTFEPRPYLGTEDSSEPGAVPRLKQVWFPGAHSDVGGGYQESGLSDLVLFWMIEEMLQLPHPPKCIADWDAELAPDPHGHRHDQIRLSPFWALTGRCHRALLDAPNSRLTLAQSAVDRLKFADWCPPMIRPHLEFSVEPYGPRLAQKVSHETTNRGHEKVDAFAKSRIAGVAAFLVWLILCFLPTGSTQLAKIQATALPRHQEALAQFQGNLVWGDWMTPLPTGTWLAIDTVAIVLAAFWMSIGITVLGEFSRGHRFWGIGLAYLAPTALISDLLENALTSLLAGPWISAEFLGPTVLGMPTSWMAAVVSVVLGVSSTVKLLAYVGIAVSFVAMTVIGLTSKPRAVWLGKLS